MTETSLAVPTADREGRSSQVSLCHFDFGHLILFRASYFVLRAFPLYRLETRPSHRKKSSGLLGVQRVNNLTPGYKVSPHSSRFPRPDVPTDKILLFVITNIYLFSA